MFSNKIDWGLPLAIIELWFLVFASPGFLFLLHWLLSGAEERHALG